MSQTLPADRFLRRTLAANAVFSAASGLAMLAAPGALASWLGLDAPWIVAVVGAGLLLFVVDLVRNARREVLDPVRVSVIATADVAWVLGTVVLLVVMPDALSTAGKWAAVAVGDVVAVFAALQIYGLRRRKRASAAI